MLYLALAGQVDCIVGVWYPVSCPLVVYYIFVKQLTYSVHIKQMSRICTVCIAYYIIYHMLL